jgi:plastocyanin
MPVFLSVILAVLFTGSPLWASSGHGDLEGTVTVTAPPRPGEPQAFSSSYGKSNYGAAPAAATPHELPEEIVVYLKKVSGTFKAPKEPVLFEQKYIQFAHRVLPILAGTTVDFVNQDGVYHNIFSNSELNPKFDLGRKPKGDSGKVKFKRPEDVKLYCEIHESMKAHILVLQNPYFTVTTPGGHYSLTHIPTGRYELVAWHDYWAPVTQTVFVKKGKSANADITLDKAQN